MPGGVGQLIRTSCGLRILTLLGIYRLLCVSNQPPSKLQQLGTYISRDGHVFQCSGDSRRRLLGKDRTKILPVGLFSLRISFRPHTFCVYPCPTPGLHCLVNATRLNGLLLYWGFNIVSWPSARRDNPLVCPALGHTIYICAYAITCNK